MNDVLLGLIIFRGPITARCRQLQYKFECDHKSHGQYSSNAQWQVSPEVKGRDGIKGLLQSDRLYVCVNINYDSNIQKYWKRNSPISHVLFWTKDSSQNTTHISMNITMLTKTKGWNNPTRHVSSVRFEFAIDSERGKVIGWWRSTGQSLCMWEPKRTIGTATETMSIAFTRFVRLKNDDIIAREYWC